MRKKIGMVIINYNDAKSTKRLLNNIKNYKCLDKIVIVDNCSTDNSLDELKAFESNHITIIKNSTNNGYAAGLNVGAKYLIKELGPCNIIFSNSDIIIKGEKDLKVLSSDINDTVAVVGPVISEQGRYNRGWKLPSTNTEILLNLPLISRYFKKKLLYYKESHFKKDISYVDVVSGCFFMVDSEALEKVDYFDETTFLYYEEQILAKKMKNINKKECIDNRVKIIHDHSVTIDKNVKKINKYKILKTSQKYYVEEYLNPNLIQKCLLYITDKLSLLILYIRCLFRR